jgi:hypothetical protein
LQPRTHEFVLRASTSDGQREIVRQQFTFSPPTTSIEREEYDVNLDGVARLELAIVPANRRRGTHSPHCGMARSRRQIRPVGRCAISVLPV